MCLESNTTVAGRRAAMGAGGAWCVGAANNRACVRGWVDISNIYWIAEENYYTERISYES